MLPKTIVNLCPPPPPPTTKSSNINVDTVNNKEFPDTVTKYITGVIILKKENSFAYTVA
jgi:hypothetical protein